jgi:lipoprotein NlpI
MKNPIQTMFSLLKKRTHQLFGYKLISEAFNLVIKFKFFSAWNLINTELDELSEDDLFNSIYAIKENNRKIQKYSNETHSFISKIKLYWLGFKHALINWTLKTFHKTYMIKETNEKF